MWKKVGDQNRNRFVFSLGCALVIVLCLGLVLTADRVVGMVEHVSSVETQFNFPRYLSQTEIDGPPPLNGTPRYRKVSTNILQRGSNINWSELDQSGPYDVVVISDSFLGGPDGEYMVRRMALEKNLSVLHIYVNRIQSTRGVPLLTLVILTNNGFLKDVGAKYVIIGFAERGIDDNIRKVTSLNESVEIENLSATEKRPKNNPSAPKQPGFLNALISSIDQKMNGFDRFFSKASINLTLVKTWGKNDLLSLTGETTSDGMVRFADLNETRFIHPVYGSRLLYHRDDLIFTQMPYPDTAIGINDDLNVLSERLNRQGISLIFIPGISAYSMHYAYIRNPPTSRNPFFEIMRELNRTYEFVDVKAFADEKLANGTPDLSGVGDPAHWTWRFTWDLGDRIRFIPAGQISAPVDLHHREEEYTRAANAFRVVAFEKKTDDPWAIRNEERIRAGIKIPMGWYSA